MWGAGKGDEGVPLGWLALPLRRLFSFAIVPARIGCFPRVPFFSSIHVFQVVGDFPIREARISCALVVLLLCDRQEIGPHAAKT